MNDNKELINRIQTTLEIDIKDFDENYSLDSSDLDFGCFNINGIY